MQSPTDPRGAVPAKAPLGERIAASLDVFSLAMVILAVLLGFVGGFIVAPALGFLVASGEVLVIGILAGIT